MLKNKLKLNDDKSECILTGPTKRRANTEVKTVQFGNSVIPLSTSVKDLGVILDSELTLDEHVSRLSKMCFFQLRNIGHIRRFLSKRSTTILVLSLVMTRLDYCNSLLAGASATQIRRLQRIQNSAARIISKTSKQDHITPVMRELHWLPIQQRITYKLMCLAYKCVCNGDAPAYLSDLLHPYIPSRVLRSDNKRLLCIPKVRTVHYGHRSFSFVVPSIWNNLPQELRDSPSFVTFKSKLKTHLFRLAYLD